jgi:hypothetical protein
METGDIARGIVAKTMENVMSNKLALTLGAAFILSTAFLSVTADASVQYHGGPKSPSTVSVSDDWTGGASPELGSSTEQAAE